MMIFYKRYFCCALFLFCGFSALSKDKVYSLKAKSSEEKTEASTHLSKDKLDFCCERDKTDESAHDMSEQEARQITMNILAPESSSRPKPRPKSKSDGQR